MEQYRKASALEERGRNIAFALLILQRRMASSTYALLKSLKRRKERLEKLLEGKRKEKGKEPYYFDLEEIEDLEESERWKREEEQGRVTWRGRWWRRHYNNSLPRDQV